MLHADSFTRVPVREKLSKTGSRTYRPTLRRLLNVVEVTLPLLVFAVHRTESGLREESHHGLGMDSRQIFRLTPRMFCFLGVSIDLFEGIDNGESQQSYS